MAADIPPGTPLAEFLVSFNPGWPAPELAPRVGCTMDQEFRVTIHWSLNALPRAYVADGSGRQYVFTWDEAARDFLLKAVAP